MIKEKRGITLIALIITIIVLLILAGVTISSISSDDGILTQAANANVKDYLAKVEDAANLDYMSKKIDKEVNGEEIKIEDIMANLENQGYTIFGAKIDGVEFRDSNNNIVENLTMGPDEEITLTVHVTDSENNFKYFIEFGNMYYEIKLKENGFEVIDKPISKDMLELANGDAKIIPSTNLSIINLNGVDITNEQTLTNGSVVKVKSKMATGTDTMKVKCGELETVFNINIEINATIIANNPKKFYGKEIINYACENSEGLDGMQIFYSDGVNIFLISSEYVLGKYLPEDDVLKVNEEKYTHDYGPWASYTLNRTGASSITDPNVLKIFKYASDYPNADYPSIDFTAYLLDTELWKKFKGDKAVYAIGGTTLDLLVKSYNSYTNENLVFGSRETGYYMGTSDNPQTTFTMNSEYCSLFSAGDRYAYQYAGGLPDAPYTHMASPLMDELGYNLSFARNKICMGGYTTYGFAFRPIVCLKEGTEISIDVNGKYNIIY